MIKNEIIKKDKKFGKYIIRNVPHTKKKSNIYEGQTVFVTNILTDMVVSEIIEYMEKAELTLMDFEEWIQIW